MLTIPIDDLTIGLTYEFVKRDGARVVGVYAGLRAHAKTNRWLIVLSAVSDPVWAGSSAMLASDVVTIREPD